MLDEAQRRTEEDDAIAVRPVTSTRSALPSGPSGPALIEDATRAFFALHPDVGLAFALVDLAGAPCRLAADAIGVSPTTIKLGVYAARRDLARCIGPSEVAPSD